MLAQIPEKRLHQVRFVLAIGWLVLIGSLLLGDSFSPSAAQTCSQNLDYCSWPYRIGPSLFWGMITPLIIIILLVLGHEAWRRICPLAFISQITTAFGVEARSQVKQKSWLARNHLYLQFGLFFVGLNCRILLVDGDRKALGFFLIFTILAAITVVYLFGGRSWCHYFCPMGPVQTVFTGPRGLLGSEAHKEPPGGITQSMCRIWDLETDHERSICVGCKSPCMDIDAEYTYWREINKPGGRLIRYGYLGIVIGFFGYLYLYAGGWDAYYSAVWSHNSNQLAQLLDPGLTIASTQIPIPKFIACPLVLALSVWITCLIGSRLEKVYGGYLKRKQEFFSHTQIRHRMFSVVTLISFNLFLICSGYPFLRQLPEPLAIAGVILVILPSSLWLHRTWHRNPDQYFKESVADSLRRNLQKLPIDLTQILSGRSLDKLESDEVYALAQVLPGLATQYQFQVYRGVLEEALETRRVDAFNCLDAFSLMRQKIGLSDEAHHSVLMELCREKPYLCYPHHRLHPDDAVRPPTKPAEPVYQLAVQEQENEARYGRNISDEQTQIAPAQKTDQTVNEPITMQQSQGENIGDERTQIAQAQKTDQTVNEPITMRQSQEANQTVEQPQVLNQTVNEPISMRQFDQANQTGGDQWNPDKSPQSANMEPNQIPGSNIQPDTVDPDDEPTQGSPNSQASLDDETTQLFLS